LCSTCWPAPESSTGPLNSVDDISVSILSKKHQSMSPRSPQGIPLPAWRRAALSVLLLVHLLAVFVGPWAMPPQGSELATSAARLLAPYLQATYLDNGYRFFAPEPGPSHLIRYEATLPDGQVVEGIFPKRGEQWPRLLYHRYFMLSEFAYSLESRAGFLAEEIERTPGAGPVLQQQAERASKLSEDYAKSYAHHLRAALGASEVRLYIRTRRIPTPQEIEAGMQLDDPALVNDELLGVDKDEA
jgi:hypothetical protein